MEVRRFALNRMVLDEDWKCFAQLRSLLPFCVWLWTLLLLPLLWCGFCVVMEFLELVLLVVLAAWSVTSVSGQHCTLGAVSYCSEVCTRELENVGVGEVRFSGVLLSMRCVPPHIKVRLARTKIKNSTYVQTKSCRCRLKRI
jgi:hypothetical protein